MAAVSLLLLMKRLIRPIYSTDGTTWDSVNIPTSASWSSISYGADKFVVVAYGSDTVAYSNNATDWDTTTMPESDNWKSVCYGGGMFVAVASNSSVYAFSTDGINWTKDSMSNSGD